jgi:ADP-ribose pyrophosphatase YjhB (NUDIX family)
MISLDLYECMSNTPIVEHNLTDVLIVKDGKFLLVEEGKPGREGLFNLPGGHVEADESLFAAAIREAKEESGYDVELTGVVGIYQSISDYGNFSGPVFCARIIGGQATTSREHPSQRWVTYEELQTLAKANKLFTTYPPFAVEHYLKRDVFPVDMVWSQDFRT